MPSKSPEQAKLMQASAHTPGGYGGVPQSVGKEFAAADAAHPRQHSLAMASATTLHKAGYISTAHRDKIHAHAGKKLDAHKKAKAPAAFGSLAPQSAGHYLSTTNPGAAQDEESGM
jgi:hypothetical protein